MKASEKQGLFKFNQTSLYVTLILILTGFLVVTQMKAQKSATEKLEMENPRDLAAIIKELTIEKDELRDKLEEEQARLENYKNASTGRRAALDQAFRNLETLRIVSGLQEARGIGIRLTIKDPKRSINHIDLIDLVTELRAAGAEVIAINKIRLTTESYFRREKRVIYIDGFKIQPPYIVEAIGNPEILYEALYMPGGIITAIDALRGVSVEFSGASRLILPASRKKRLFRFTKPL